ncbi:unnamed protein product [Pleuronectes platessa]|uniref:Uncharacterized protein n=1 Tax=Pleuronectes platessa TaxID=8262 RepID=A0A9N7V393_PLEPL|nr:unnamed protein product [Pleuronectes platessa]
MRVDIPKDNPNMTCQAVPLQAQSMLSNHLDHDPPSRPDATPVLSHRPPPPTRTHHKRSARLHVCINSPPCISDIHGPIESKPDM